MARSCAAPAVALLLLTGTSALAPPSPTPPTPRDPGAAPRLGRYIKVDPGPNKVWWEMAGRKHLVTNCSMCPFTPDPCSSWQPVTQSYADKLFSGDKFSCAMDWPPWPEHLTPRLHNSPPCLAVPLWHDITAALTTSGGDEPVTHHIWQGCIPQGGFPGTPGFNPACSQWGQKCPPGSKPPAPGLAWHHSTSSDFVTWEQHGNALGLYSGFALQDPREPETICAVQKAAGPPADEGLRTPAFMACADRDALDDPHGWRYDHDHPNRSALFFPMEHRPMAYDPTGWRVTAERFFP